MKAIHQFTIATAALTIAIAGFSGIAGAVSSDSSFFFDTFDGPLSGNVNPQYPDITEGSFNPTGGIGIDAEFEYAGVQGMVVDFDRQGVFFAYTNCRGPIPPRPDAKPCGANEYRAELTSPLKANQEYVVEVVWEVDDSSWVVEENATMLSGRGESNGSQGNIPRLEAKFENWAFDSGGINEWGAATYDLQFNPRDGDITVAVPAGDMLGLSLNKGELITIAAHNLGDGTLVERSKFAGGNTYDGTVDLYVNSVFVDTYAAGAGDLEVVGNLGNNSASIPNGFSGALLHSVSVGLPVTGPGPSLTGDANKDGSVTGADLISVQQNFGKVGSVPLQGDANDSGDVTGADLISVQQNFGAVADQSLSPVPVPEPTGLAALLALGGLGVLRRP